MLNKEYYKNTPLCEIIKEVPCSMNSYEFEQWLNSEHPILNKKEKDYLRNLILPFYDNVKVVTKNYLNDGKCFIGIDIKNKNLCTNENVFLPYFRENEMYCGMERGKEYSLRELGIFK